MFFFVFGVEDGGEEENKEEGEEWKVHWEQEKAEVNNADELPRKHIKDPNQNNVNKHKELKVQCAHMEAFEKVKSFMIFFTFNNIA